MLEENKIHQGDCMELMKHIPDKSVDMILCDLPYGTTACKWDIILPFDKLWNELKRIRKDNTAILLFGSEPFSSRLRLSNINEFKYDWIWDKKRVSNPLLSKKMPLKNYEIISVFYKSQPKYYPIPTKKSTGKSLSNKGHNLVHSTDVNANAKIITNRDTNDIGYPKMLLTDIKVMNNLSKDKGGLHPTQKPIELMEYFIKTYTDENNLVLDFTIGSGTTAVACKQTNRRFIGIELSQEYVDIANERLKFTTVSDFYSDESSNRNLTEDFAKSSQINPTD